MTLANHELNLTIGTEVKLYTGGRNNTCYAATFIGFASDKSLIFSTPLNSKTPLLANIGEEFLVRMNSGDKQIAFRSDVVEVRDHPYAYIHMRYPSGFEESLVRRRPRYAIPEKDQAYLKIRLEKGDKQVQVKMSDISETGACLYTDSQLGMINDLFSMEMRVAGRLINLDCRIRYIRIENHEHGPTDFVHGIAFEEPDLNAQRFIEQLVQQSAMRAGAA